MAVYPSGDLDGDGVSSSFLQPGRTRCCKRLYTYSINVEGEKECKLCRSVFRTRVREENILLVVCYVPDLVRVITSKGTQGKRSCFG